MRTLWVSADIDGAASASWTLLTDTARWPDWGPTVRAASLDSASIDLGARGTVATVGGLRLPFEITGFEPGRRWSWHVAGVPATDHLVEPVDSHRCRVSFGVPWPAAPYLAVCRVALERLADLVATRSFERSS